MTGDHRIQGSSFSFCHFFVDGVKNLLPLLGQAWVSGEDCSCCIPPTLVCVSRGSDPVGPFLHELLWALGNGPHLPVTLTPAISCPEQTVSR